MKIEREFNEKEILILKHIASGKDDNTIAEILNTNAQTLRYWIAKLFSTFNAANRAHLVAQAIRHKVIK